MNVDPLEIIKKADSELHAGIGAGRELAFRDGEISKKNKLLIALAIDAAEHSVNGVRSLVMQAMGAGATKTEIMETLRVVHYICGAGTMYSAAGALQDLF